MGRVLCCCIGDGEWPVLGGPFSFLFFFLLVLESISEMMEGKGGGIEWIIFYFFLTLEIWAR